MPLRARAGGSLRAERLVNAQREAELNIADIDVRGGRRDME
jgi:hypothetical protein